MEKHPERKMEPNEAIAMCIKNLMITNSMTVKELAKFTKLPVRTIEKIINGEYRKVGLEKVFIICRAFNISLLDFYADVIFNVLE